MIESAQVIPTEESFGARSLAPLAATSAARTATHARLVLGAVFGTRVLVWMAALATVAIFGENEVARHTLDPGGVTPSIHAAALTQLLAPAARWDGVWYLQIASHGYFSPASANFFPLYPLLVHLAMPLFGNAIVAGIAISLASMVVAMTLLYRLTLLDLGEPAARMTIILVAVFPTSLFLSAVYSTSLYLMLTMAAVFAARRERWALAGLCGGLAAATRSSGIFLVILLALMYLYGPRGRSPLRAQACAWWRPRFRVERDFAWLVLVPAGLLMYLGYLWVTHSAPLAPYRAAHLYWGHSFGPPIGAVIDALGGLPGDLAALVNGTVTQVGPGDPIGWQARNLIDLLFLALAVLAIRVAWSRVPRVYVIYAVVGLAQVTSFPASHEPMIGLERYMLPLFALFMGAGAYLANHRVAARITFATSTALLVLFSALWGYWALVP